MANTISVSPAGTGYISPMTEAIEDCDVYAGSSYPVAISHGHRVRQKVDLKARVDVNTGEVTFYIPTEQIEKLRD